MNALKRDLFGAQPRQPRRRCTQKGFSLLEMLVAFSIMALSLGMLYKVSGNNIRLVVMAARQDQASALAESLLNAIDVVPEAGLQQAGESASYQWAIRSAPYAGGATELQAAKLQQIWISITWNENDVRRRIDLTTLLPQRKP